jgi:hypothetical protein
MRPYRARFRGQGVFFAFQSWRAASPIYSDLICDRHNAACVAKQSTDVEALRSQLKHFDLNGEARMAKAKQSSPIISPV